ncbi:MAG: long-chain-acyl-CoA synthetase [Fluviicoccus sp.]|uniref:long-chain-acyl-CoA synthetase n=1 Tax=Fluviicoccus sp. TaxID=2003552 RepID=UPI00271985BC|nr:long-chain-acyl-CoA synthetase [Fluviicoccus sp.]MDO8330618.1 long-chain-acyl-CoA synthetase [Fluviicoccus sp.]
MATQIGFRDIARGILQAAPEMLDLNRGNLLRLAGLNPDSRQSIGKVVEFWARWTPDRVALRFDDRAWTYRELNAWANRLANLWAARGIRSGDTVAILMENRPEVLACVIAAMKLGAIAAMLNHHQRAEVLSHSIGLVRMKLLVISSECRDAIESTVYTPQGSPNLPCFWCGGDSAEPAPDGWLDLEQASAGCDSGNPATTGDVRAHQPCFYIFTSGTTGMPKASVMTHYRWLASMAGVGGLTVRLRRDDVFYCCLPLYHNNALTVSLGCVLSVGATLALDRKFSASRFWDRVRHFDATAFCYIGELLRYLLNRPESAGDRNHRIRAITGNGLRPEIWEAFEQRFGITRIFEFYGASESNIAFINAFGVTQTAGFTPLPFAIVEFDAESETPLRDVRGHMQRVAKGGVGLLISEVTARRPFDGYTDPAAGEKKLFRDVFKQGDVWFNSGDLVRDQGLRHIQFVDRVGDTFRWKGENVATGEIEGVLAREPSVDHGVVYGVSVPGCDGRAGMAAITLKPGVSFDGKALADSFDQALPAYAVPLFIRLQTEQQTTGTFKYRKVELKQEGFDPGVVGEPLYVLADRAQGYQPLTAELFVRITQGGLRL